MNIALPAAALIVALLPGIVLLLAYRGDLFPRSLSVGSPLTEFAYYLIAALPLDATAYYALARVPGRVPNFEQFFDVLQGANVQIGARALGDVLSDFAWGPLLAAYLLLLVIALMLGDLLRRLVWASRWDMHLGILRMRHDWYYRLFGRLAGLPRRVVAIADVLVRHEDGTRLYRGIVRSFGIDDSGNLREVVLREVLRYRSSEPNSPSRIRWVPSSGGGASPPEKLRWKSIPGDQFMILASTIDNMNLQYIALSDPARGKWSEWWESFWFDDV